jgi:hypothetical protein
MHKKKSKEAEVDLKKAKDDETRIFKDGEIEHHRLQEIIAEEEINDTEKQLFDVKEAVRTEKNLKQSCKYSLKKDKHARGRPTENIISQFEKVLGKYNAKHITVAILMASLVRNWLLKSSRSCWSFMPLSCNKRMHHVPMLRQTRCATDYLQVVV